MKQRKFEKAPAFVGKYLCLHVGAGDRTIHDGEVLIGEKFAPFVNLGYLVEIKDEQPEAKVETATAPKPEAKPDAPEVKPEAEPKAEPEAKADAEPEPKAPEPPQKADGGGTTKSPAQNVADAQKRGKKRKKGKR